MPVYATEIKVAVQPVTFHQFAIPYTNVTPPAATDTSYIVSQTLSLVFKFGLFHTCTMFIGAVTQYPNPVTYIAAVVSTLWEVTVSNNANAFVPSDVIVCPLEY